MTLAWWGSICTALPAEASACIITSQPQSHATKYVQPDVHSALSKHEQVCTSKGSRMLLSKLNSQQAKPLVRHKKGSPPACPMLSPAPLGHCCQELCCQLVAPCLHQHSTSELYCSQRRSLTSYSSLVPSAQQVSAMQGVRRAAVLASSCGCNDQLPAHSRMSRLQQHALRLCKYHWQKHWCTLTNHLPELAAGSSGGSAGRAIGCGG